MNGLRFDRDSILTKTENQYLNVSLYVNNHFDNKLHQLTVHRLDTELVNGYRIWQDTLDEAVLVTRRMQEQNVVATPVAFQEKLVVDRLSLEGDTLFGAKIQDVQLNMGVRKLLDEQARGFTTLLDTVERAVQPSANGESGLHVRSQLDIILCICFRSLLCIVNGSAGDEHKPVMQRWFALDKVFWLNFALEYLWCMIIRDMCFSEP